MFGIHAIYDCSIDGIIRIIHTVLTGLQFEGERRYCRTGLLRRCLHGKRYRFTTIFIRCHVGNGFNIRNACCFRNLISVMQGQVFHQYGELLMGVADLIRIGGRNRKFTVC